jgi:elongation factor 1-gamma
MTLHAFVGCPASLTTMLTVKACNLNIKFKYYTSAAEVEAFGGRLPCLETEEGRISNMEAIVRYLSGLKAYLHVGGQSAFDKAQVDLWMDMVRNDLASGLKIRGIESGVGEWTQEALDSHRKAFGSALGRFEEHLALRTYFVGHSVTLADLAFTAALASNRASLLCVNGVKEFPNVNRHFQFMTNTTFYQAVMGRSFGPLAKAMPLADSAKTKEFASPLDSGIGGAQGPNSKGKPAPAKAQGQAKGKQAPKKKEAPPPPVKVEKPELTPAELAEQEAENAASTWFFDYKTLFVNATDRNAAIDQLVKEWDAKRFSMWFTKYDKLPSECNNLIRTNNMLSFFFRGLEGLNKHVLAAFGAYGAEENHDLMGKFLFRLKF